MIYRIIGGFFISPGASLAQGVVVEMFFAKERGQKMVSILDISQYLWH
jgi:hypothetical protein